MNHHTINTLLHRSIAISLVALFLCVVARAQTDYVFTTFHEPATDGLRMAYSRDALHWSAVDGSFLAPTMGRQRVLRDPSVMRTPDGVYRLVWTSSWRGDRGFGYAESRDLIRWNHVSFVTVMNDTSTVNVWAPEWFWDDKRQQAMVVWASCVPGRFEDGSEAHDNNHRLYYSVTKDFRTFTPGRLLFDPGFSCIDATIVKRGKSDYVMVFKDNTRKERNLKVAFASDPLGPWGHVSPAFTESFCEGPAVVPAPDGGPWGRGWLIYYDRYRRHDFGASFTSDFVHFKDISDSIVVPAGHKHGTIVQVPRAIVRALTDSARVNYTGETLADPSRHDGGLSPVVGVHNIQILRANREHPSVRNGGGWTYNHQPMMAYWNGKFYVHYLADEAEEHVPPSHTMMQTSDDGYHWSDPVELFPTYNVPEGFHKPNYKVHPDLQYPDSYKERPLKAIMHQRVGWYVAKNGLLLALGNYGVALDRKDDPNDGNGIGRVVRQVHRDGRLGPIYFIYYNHGFSEKNTDYPNYRRAPREVRKACEELLANPRYLMQWVEEADRDDRLIPVNNLYKAYCDYTLPDGKSLVALWKHALTSVSRDGGRTWSATMRAPGFVNSNAKIWGQRLSDGTYATVYNPAEFRWPLALSLSGDGLNYNSLHLLCGEVPPMRYGGNYKSRGPQYVRGIQEGNGVPADSDLWVTYSMNKEDIWVAHVPVPVMTKATSHADDDFGRCQSLADLSSWNLYSPLMAPVSLDGAWLQLADADPFDYAVAERVVPGSRKLKVEFDIRAGQNNHGRLQMELKDHHGVACTRVEFSPDGFIFVKSGARQSKLMAYRPNETYHVVALLDAPHRMLTLTVNGKKTSRVFFAPVHKISRVVFRTGEQRFFPTIDTPADWYGTLDGAGESAERAVFRIAHFRTRSLDADAGAAVLQAADYKAYVDEFNRMDEENVVQAIPNADAWKWMEANIPLFDAPDKGFEQMWYYRWWTLRKHIKSTPVGYVMTEFLVPRSYADRYNLISSALGHHIHEARWLRNPRYLDENIRTWLYGNDGQPMAKLDFYSSWLSASLWDRYLVDGRKDSLVSLLPRMKWEYGQWEGHRWNMSQGLGPYWQYDVRDAMEETISGGRRERNARPSINSYMFGNARAIAETAKLSGDNFSARLYQLKADSIKHWVETLLWNDSAQFFEVIKPVTVQGMVVGHKPAQVREAVGFIPWYFRLPADNARLGSAWSQIVDTKGFSAPYGLTTAERRHPDFRSHGTGRCEWDGAIWPFATSQTLTALANFLNDYRHWPTLTGKSWKMVYFSELEKYVQCQSHRGKPYIGEYLDESTGTWLMGDRERSRYYNHSTFADLIITGLCGLRPRADSVIEVNPLIPEELWAWFCLDNVPYHGHRLTIVWDADGSRYHVGQGLRLFVDGRLCAWRPSLGRLEIFLESGPR